MKRYAFVVLAACGGGGGSGGGGDDGPGIDAAMPTHAGYVDIQSYDAMNSPNTPTRGGYANAGFWMEGSYCTTLQTIGACDVAQCRTSSPPLVSAGTVTITGAAQPVTLTPSATNDYAPLMTTTPLFGGGETLTVAASGATVPAFTKMIKVPAKATITQPAKPSPYLIVNRAQDFTVTWTGGGSGKVQVSLNSEMADRRLFCSFDASAGTGKIPSAALSMFSAGMGGFAMTAITQEHAIAGDWDIEVAGLFNAVWPDNSIVSGPTTFQ